MAKPGQALPAVCVTRSPACAAVGGGGAALLAGATEGCQGPGPMGQRPAGRSPTVGAQPNGEVALITQHHPLGNRQSWASPRARPETGNADVPRGRDRDDGLKESSFGKGTQPRTHSWRLEQGTLPSASCAWEDGPALARVGSPRISEAQLRALRLKPDTFYPSTFGTAGPEAALSGRQPSSQAS